MARRPAGPAAPKGPAATQAANNDGLRSVRFIRPWGIYCNGDLAGFPQPVADRLVNKLKVAIRPHQRAEVRSEDDKPVGV